MKMDEYDQLQEELTDVYKRHVDLLCRGSATAWGIINRRAEIAAIKTKAILNPVWARHILEEEEGTTLGVMLKQIIGGDE